MSAPFTHRHRVRLAQTDAAGVVFVTEPLAIAHVAWEALLDALDQPVSRRLSERRFALPIVEASTRILRPIRVGDDVEVTVTREKLGRSSLISVHALAVAGSVAVQWRAVHVAVDAAGRTTPLPDDLVAGLCRLPLIPRPADAGAARGRRRGVEPDVAGRQVSVCSGESGTRRLASSSRRAGTASVDEGATGRAPDTSRTGRSVAPCGEARP